MEFLYANYINTTTQIAVNSNTGTADNLFTRDSYAQYYTDGLNDDNTAASITITFDATTSVSRIALLDTNAKQFTLFYNGATASTFTLIGDTTVSSWTNNTDENKFLRCSTVSVSSITLDIKTTQTANQEKRLGLLYIGDVLYDMDQIPSASDYDPVINPKQVVHNLSDGGTRIHNIRNKWKVSIKLDYITTAQRDSLKDVWALQNEFNFCPFGTSTGWDGFMFEAVWTGGFDFYQYSDNAAVSGFSGSIKLAETPT